MTLQQLSPEVLSWLLNILAALAVMALPTLAVGAVRLIRVKEAQMETATAGTNNQQVLLMLREVAALAVKGAEQYLGSGQGEAKKMFAIETVQNLLASHGITTIDFDAAEAAVEAAVFMEINDSKPKPRTAPAPTPAASTTTAS